MYKSNKNYENKVNAHKLKMYYRKSEQFSS